MISKGEKKGKNRIIEKIKEIRKEFSEAFVTGTHSGSGKIMCKHYDQLDETNDDSIFRKELSEAIRKSTKHFSESVSVLSNSMVQMANNIGETVKTLAQAFVYQNHQKHPLQQQRSNYPSQGGLYTNLLRNDDPKIYHQIAIRIVLLTLLC